MKKHEHDFWDKVARNEIKKTDALKDIEKRHGRFKRSERKQPVTCAKSFTYDDNILKDHQLFQTQVLMGVTHISLALNALKKMYPDLPLPTLNKVTFYNAIRFDESERLDVITRLDGGADSVRFQNVYSRGSGPEKISAAGEAVYSGKIAPSRSAVLEDFIKGATKEEAAEVFYDDQETYGKSLFTLKKIYHIADGVLGYLSLSSEMVSEISEYVVHPAIFDAGYVNSLFAAGLDLIKKDVWVPLFIKSIKVLGDVPAQCYCHTHLIKKTDELIITDNEYYDESGRLVLVVEAMNIKRVPSAESLLGNEEPASVVLNDGAKTGDAEKPINRKARRGIGGGSVREKIEAYIVADIGRLVKNKDGALNLEKNFMDLGIDSSQLIKIAQNIEKDVGIELYPTLFFEYQNVKELADYFAAEHKSSFEAYFGVGAGDELPDENASAGDELSGESHLYDVVSENSRFSGRDEGCHDIAVIGMSGRFAGSRNLSEFWGHISAAEDMIKEVPGDHWDWREWYDEDRNAANKAYSKWGSFIDDVDKFDPVFFGISPREAVWLDPQLRILHEVTYETIEDAGYARRIAGTNTGVYVGVCFQEYWDEVVRNHIPLVDYQHESSVMSSISSWISYRFDLQGASIPLDNACASSLTALHLACHALRRGENDIAIVAGTNLLLSPLHYVYFSRIQALSPTGHCHSFDARADGYVPGEGVVAIMLKPLQRAIEDNDNIHAVIKGTAINHVGRSSNPTAPRPELQTKLLLNAWEDAGVPSETLSYLECHGTGTQLGDPIEINALKKAFRHHTDKAGFCAIGSTKAHIGHLEGAAGVASVVKVILQMKHGTIPRMPDFRELNPYIKLEGSPLYINRELLEWNPPSGVPRRAGVSSFGMTGNNAHVVLEEYVAEKSSSAAVEINGRPNVFVLSAASKEQLADYVEGMKGFFKTHDDLDHSDVSYTLQIGREAMRERLAVVFESIDELSDKLGRYVKGEDDIDGLYSGNSKEIREPNNEDMVSLFDNENLKEMASSWASGTEIDWGMLYKNREFRPRRISLPTYPFKRERCWMSGVSGESAVGVSVGRLHDLLDSNESTLKEQRYCKVLNGSEYFLRDHVVGGSKILPGVVYLEMARLAAELAGEGSKVQGVSDVVWLKPVVVEGAGAEVHVSLYPGNGDIEYEVTSGVVDGGERVVNCRGKISYGEVHGPSAVERIDLEGIRARCPEIIDRESCYRAFDERGLTYGPNFQGIRELRRGDGEALAEIELPEGLKGGFGDYVLHPSLMDAALQSVIGAMGNVGEGTYVPFSLGGVEILRRMETPCYSHVRARGDRGGASMYFDIDVVNGSGEILIRMKNFGVRLYGKEMLKKSRAADAIGGAEGLLYLYEEWVEEAADSDVVPLKGNLLFIGDDETIPTRLQEKLGNDGRIFYVKNGEAYKALEAGRYEVKAGDGDDYRKVVKDLVEKGACPDSIVFLWEGDGPGDDVGDIRGRLDAGVYAVYGLTRALMEENPKREARIVCVGKGRETNPHVGGLSGFARSANFENPKFTYKILSLAKDVSPEDMASVIEGELERWSDKGVLELKYEGGKRYCRRLREREGADIGPNRLNEGGVYIITGGIGGLGAIFSRHLAKLYKARLLLSDVRDLDERGAALLEEIKGFGGEPLYVRCDVTNREEVEDLVRTARERFGRISGIIHAAGAIRDSLIIRKKREEMDLVLNAKILGAVNLDAVTRDDDLELFITFASAAGVMGNAGQSDYAYANRFLDHFVEWRDGLCARGERHGRTLSIEWPLWAQGGMIVGEETKQWLKQTLGLDVLPTEQGLRAFERACEGHANRIMVIYGDTLKMRQSFGVLSKRDAVPDSDVSEVQGGGVDALLFDKLSHDIMKMVAAIIEVDERDVDIDAEMSEYGFDSITITELITGLNGKFHINLTPAVFFEHGTIVSIVHYLLEAQRVNISDHYQVKIGAEKPVPKRTDTPVVASHNRPRFAGGENYEDRQKYSTDPIAIVGMNGAFPESSDLDEFWRHLERCDDLISEIPPDRWDWREYDGNPMTEGAKTKSRWGGFMKEVDKFDAPFFGIAPHEAELMDPQQRIFLEVVWKTIEDAGYATSSLSGTRTGLFVGVSTSNYHDLLLKSGADAEAHSSTGLAHSILPNRISYLLNLRGPSEPIDTACSSSLIALHRAVRAIQDGDCDMALAGGVSVILTPRLHISFGKAGMLSDNGRCKTFDKSANGYVRGEGAGAVLLKKLSQAVRDGDHIYGIVRASAENHGGHVSSLTVPNPLAQAELLEEAYERAKIEPWRVGFIECHGTGTTLGDPVEVNGLKRAFSEMYRKYGRAFSGNAYCGLSAVKTNIGHLEAAAGIAGVIKALLSLQHGEIPGLVHFTELNPYIDLSGSPFYMLEKTMEWKRFRDENGNEMPRVAGVSSFGFGGANAHVVIEEYVPDEPARAHAGERSERPEIIVLSARDRERLNYYAGAFLRWMEGGAEREREGENSEVPDIERIAYTLQVGRDAMNERLAVVVSGVEELKQKLRRYLEGKNDIEGLHTGNKKMLADRDVSIGQSEDDRHYIRDLFVHGNMAKLAALWASGSEIDWEVLYGDLEKRPERISLPTYPFKRERYWVPDVSAGYAAVGRLHDLLDSNESTIEEQRYRKELSGSEYYLRDHIVGGSKILPGAAYLEMARIAAELAGGGTKVKALRNVRWMEALRVEGEKIDVVVNLLPADAGLEFEVSSGSGNGHARTVNAVGDIEYVGGINGVVEDRVDLEAVLSRCTEILSIEECYRIFRQIGLDYGPSFQSIRELRYCDTEALARLELPAELRAHNAGYVLHPSLMDGAFQSVMALVKDEGVKKLYIPLSVGEVEIVSPLETECFAHVRCQEGLKTGDRMFDIIITDNTGKILVGVGDFAIHEVRTGKDRYPSLPDEEMLKILQRLETGEVNAEEVKRTLGIH